MDYAMIGLCLGCSLAAGFVHGAIGMGYGMIAMAALTLFMPFNTASAIVAVALLLLVCQISIALRKCIDWRGIWGPCLSHLAGKILGIVLMMRLQSGALRIALGVFLVAYSALQLLDVRSLRIKGTALQGLVFCGIGGLFGGIFNVSGPFASIYCQARYAEDPKAYSANMNMSFVPAAFVAVIMHGFYGNFDLTAIGASGATLAGVLAGAALGVSVLKKLSVKTLRRVSYVSIIIMGLVICFV